MKDIHLVHSLKQDGEQFQFKVLDKDKKGVRFYKKDRFYFWYKAQHVLSTQGGASGQLLHGEFESFYDTKQLSGKGEFRKGLKDKEWLYWRKDGTLIRSEYWRRGRLKGVEKHYDTSGKVVQTIRYKRSSYRRENSDTILVGKKGKNVEKVYLKDSLGEVSRVENKKNGVLHGTVKRMEKGKVVEKTKYKNGRIVSGGKDVDKEGEETEIKKKKLLNFSEKKTDKTDKTDDSRKKKNKKEEVKEPGHSRQEKKEDKINGKK